MPLRIIIKSPLYKFIPQQKSQRYPPRFRPGGLLSHVLQEVFGIASRRILCHPIGTQGLLMDVAGDAGVLGWTTETLGDAKFGGLG